MQTTIEPTTYVTRVEELVWGLVLISISLVVHGFGMVLTLYATGKFRQRFATTGHFLSGIGVIVLGSWMIVAVQIVEIGMWAGFFQWKHCFENYSTAVYFTGLEYTTVGSTLNLPMQWRLLEIMVASAGLMGFAWSTCVLMTLAQEFQQEQLRRFGSPQVMDTGSLDSGVPESRQTDISATSRDGR